VKVFAEHLPMDHPKGQPLHQPKDLWEDELTKRLVRS
jgi:hypothetical protein